MAQPESEETVTPDPGNAPEAPATPESDNSAPVDDDDKPMTRRELREFLAAQKQPETPPAKKAAAPAKKAAAPAKSPARTADKPAAESQTEETPAKKRTGVSRTWFGSRAD